MFWKGSEVLIHRSWSNSRYAPSEDYSDRGALGRPTKGFPPESQSQDRLLTLGGRGTLAFLAVLQGHLLAGVVEGSLERPTTATLGPLA